MTDDQDQQTGGGGAGFSGANPKGPGDLFGKLLGGDRTVFEQIDKNARGLAQSALAKLDVVSREEFDAQSRVLQRTRERVELLEAELQRLTALLEQLDAPTAE
jgi:BMFP domain-containing protein YqiC